MGSASLDPLSNKAIEAALNNRWNEAVELNASLLKTYPDDVETLNRLARAYYESGKLNKAKSTYKSVLSIDPYNPIANKNFKKLSELKDTKTPVHNGNGHASVVLTDLFLEEPGRTKIIKLLLSKSSARLANMRTGDPVVLKSKYHDVAVLDQKNKQLGVLDPKWARRIAEAIRLGCKFEAYLVATNVGDEMSATIFVRETNHSKELGTRMVFPIEKLEDFRPYVTEEALTLITSKGPSVNQDEGSSQVENSSTPDENASLETLAAKEQEEMDNYNSEDS